MPCSCTSRVEAKFAAVSVAATPQLPAIGLIVSGGHTLIVHVRADGTSERLGGTIDDAAGEAFDKIARLLGLPYPGGAALSALAATATARAGGDRLPVARVDGEYDVSFSGCLLYTSDAADQLTLFDRRCTCSTASHKDL